MKIESKFAILEVLGDTLTFKNKVHSKYKKGIYNFKIVNTEDIEKIKEFFKRFKNSMYINFYHDFENDRIEIEYQSIKTSKILDSIIVDFLD